MNLQSQLLWLWLAGVLGSGAEHSGELLALYGDAAEVYRARHTEDFSGVLSPAQVQRLQSDEQGPRDYLPVLQDCERRCIRVLTLSDTDYPAAIASLPDAPPVLYCTGRADCLNRGPFLGMVGSRTPSAYGVRAARALGGELAKQGAVIVSGLADGLDGEAHGAALEAGGVTVGILGCAIDRTYPAAHAELRRRMERSGAVLSEYAPGTRSYSGYFLQRNRLIAGLSDVLCVLEARQRSGTMSTVRRAKDYGRPVFAVPGSIFSTLSEGTNQLLAAGEAQPVLGAADLGRALGLQTSLVPARHRKKKTALPEDPQERAVLAALGEEPRSLEAIAAAAQLPAGRVLALLTKLELSGRVQAQAGGRYSLRL